MENFIGIKQEAKSFEQIMNELYLEISSMTEKDFLDRLHEIEGDLCWFYNLNFQIKSEKKDNVIYCEVYLNNKILINFKANF